MVYLHISILGKKRIMSMRRDGPSMEELVERLVELERANAHMREELVALRAERQAIDKQVEIPMQTVVLESRGTFRKPKVSQKSKSRRGLLAKGLVHSHQR
jgi:hypothetical protein